MDAGTFILTEGDDADELAGSGNVISFNRPELDDPLSIGDLSAIIVSDAAVKMRGQFQLPRLAVTTDREESNRS